MDREEIARAHRRRQAADALGFEREREATLQEQIGDLIAELEGAGVDEEVFTRMSAEDAALVRSLLDPPEDEVEEMTEEERRLLYGDESLEIEEPDPREWIEEEIARLEEEITESRRRQHALERYLEALDPPG